MAKCMETDPNGGYHLIKENEIAFWEQQNCKNVFVRMLKDPVNNVLLVYGAKNFKVVSVDNDGVQIEIGG